MKSKKKRNNIENAFTSSIGLGWFGLIASIPFVLYFSGISVISAVSGVLSALIGLGLLLMGRKLKEAHQTKKDQVKRLKNLRLYTIIVAIVSLFLFANYAYALVLGLIAYYSIKALKEASSPSIENDGDTAN